VDAKGDEEEVESMAEMSAWDGMPWSNVWAKTDLAAEKMLTESITSGHLETLVTGELACAQAAEEPKKLGPSISGAIEAFVTQTGHQQLSDKQIKYKLHRLIEDQSS
jgi:hypothetical protein